ncbi:putative bifunctional diguanylate cyclase/phosphodiesterase [Couchioplanes caeruleus]|uniref:Diguanylate cyclase n=2 Tax=Couchioplanes caeruleus TaxID=56438 RepID=A0A1K0FT68_9ACTN|nr:bifunctional diguanylate cyclase/phosphodiesterase [Couchioplanes caeruleus]OJF16055.1 diguanylate cyclase [Couchioplanes caeruleus subsp. caeruleus]ROP29938.1 diguanylate cyclase (GGDEF)-like protein [Couchioplanes caeruleus]
MSRTGKTMDRVRLCVDGAMIFAALLLLAWPPFLEDAGALGRVAGLAAVAAASTAVMMLTRRLPLVRYVPVAVAVLMAGFWFGRQDAISQGLMWLTVAVAAIILCRQFLGARSNESIVRDLTRQRAQLARQASCDPLTELGNRKLFLDHATDALADADDTMTAVILFDLDGFKEVNDTYGHATGDELLRTAASRLLANVRTNDTVSRLGGDEFVVLLPRLIDDQIADTVANRILMDLAQPLLIGDHVLSIPASAGIAITRGSGRAVDEVMREADLALYQAKEEGKNVARRFDPAQFAAAEARRREEADLRRALDAGEFEVHYQPIVDLEGERTVGVEALIRWNHPERGMIPPIAFLDIAESLGLLPRLGGWVLEEACKQAAVWQRQNPGFELNVNLSASQLGNPNLVEEVRSVLERTGLPPSLLVLELTESVALVDLVESARVLGALKTLGVRIALDDFGTGFSSLSHLGTLPVDVVKIDKSFVQAMQENSSGASVAEAVLQIARTFKLSPVAEGVEDATQASRLRELECAQAQGYHFARPMPAGALTELLARQSAIAG